MTFGYYDSFLTFLPYVRGTQWHSVVSAAEAIISTVFVPMYKDRRQKTEIETKTVNVKEIQKNNNAIQLVVPFYYQTSTHTETRNKV